MFYLCLQKLELFIQPPGLVCKIVLSREITVIQESDGFTGGKRNQMNKVRKKNSKAFLLMVCIPTLQKWSIDFEISFFYCLKWVKPHHSPHVHMCLCAYGDFRH